MSKVLVTGSSDGLGLMAVRRLLAAGHEVVLHACNQDRARDALVAARRVHSQEWGVLEVLAQNGLTVESVAGTAKMRIGVPAVRAQSTAEATAKARDRLLQLVPTTGYRLSEPEPVNVDGGK